VHSRRSRSHRNTQFRRGLDPRGDARARGLEPGANRGALATRRRAQEQPRDDLPARVGRQTCGGELYRHLRGAQKLKWKRYGAYDSRGRLAGKRPIATRPAEAEHRSRFGHWEGDTVLGAGQAGPCVLTLGERKSGFLALGKLEQRTGAFVTAPSSAQPRLVRTITVDNGTEFHSYERLEARVPARFYFATPHHAWERGTNENSNGLLRQYLPKDTSMAHHATRLQPPRHQAQPPAPQTARLPHPGGGLCP